jgi:hypothetical protein
MVKKVLKRGLPPMHPGELLREEILPALNRSKTEIARLLGVSRQTLYDIDPDIGSGVTPSLRRMIVCEDLRPPHEVGHVRPSGSFAANSRSLFAMKPAKLQKSRRPNTLP